MQFSIDKDKKSIYNANLARAGIVITTGSKIFEAIAKAENVKSSVEIHTESY
tara:strand:+ start:204 stop:359 length:156 start_codon:yes stop_codon:yes gene_type:complete